MFFSRERGYSFGMDAILLPPRTLTISCSMEAAGEQVITLIAELAGCGPVTVLDSGNCFPAYRLLRALRGRTPDLPAAARRVYIRRAFTCHQVVALLDATPARPQPYILLDLLATFFDEQVPLPETSRLLDGCLRQVERLSGSAPVLVTLTPPRTPERAEFIGRVSARANRLYLPEILSAPILQPLLF